MSKPSRLAKNVSTATPTWARHDGGTTDEGREGEVYLEQRPVDFTQLERRR